MAVCWVILRGQLMYTVIQAVHSLLNIVANLHKNTTTSRPSTLHIVSSVYSSEPMFLGHKELGCEHNGVSYQEGQVFQPSCALQCHCSGGGVTCVPRCSEDVLLPTPDCPHPRRVQQPGKCCKEWVCENMDNTVLQDAHIGTSLPVLMFRKQIKS